MQRSGIAAVGGFGLLGLLAGQANAVVLFDSHGFEPSTDATINYRQDYLQGQPGGATGTNQWKQAPSATAGATPYAAIYATGQTTGNTQYLQVGASAVPVTNYNFFYTQTNVSNPFTPTAGQGVAITWAMSVLSYQASLNNNAFFGVVAYGNDATGTNVEIGRLGIDGTTGAIVGGGTTVSSFVAADDTYYNYELLLNYTTRTYSIYTAPATATSASDYTLRKTGTFAGAAVNYTDADIAAFSQQTTAGATYTGYANFDNMLVQTVAVPEPASVGFAAVATGLIGLRRRRAVVR